MNHTKISAILIIFFTILFCSSAEAIDAGSFDYGNDNPEFRLGNKPEGIYTITSGTIDAVSSSSCPSWCTVIDRDGIDGGHLTVELDSCQISEYTLYYKAQGDGTGHIAYLEPDDVFIEWDEDPGHGSAHYFSFRGEYVECTDELPPYLQVEGTGSTNWTVYCVVSSGELVKTNDCCNEHEAIHITAKCPIVLEKVDDVNNGDCVGPGDEITYTIDYNYLGDANCPDINDVNIIDYLPDEVDYVSSVPLGDYNGVSHTVIWNIGTLSPGDANSVTLKVNVRCPDPCGTITNECKLMRDVNEVVREAEENTSVCGLPTFTKVDDVNDCVGPGDYITYSICYTANGYSDTNVVITDELPPEVEFVSATGDYEHISGIVTWDVGTLGSDDSNCVTLTVRVKCAAPGAIITNCCEMTGDCMTSAVTACENTSVCGPPTLTKADDVNDCVRPGDYITYDICYTANGYGDTNVVIADELPPEVEFVSATGDYEYISGTVTWDIGTLGPDDSNCVTLTVEVKCAAPGAIITNCCEMTGDCMTSTVTACEETPMCYYLTLTKQDNVPDGSCVEPGDEIVYSIYYDANGYGDTNVVIIDYLPDKVDFVSADFDSDGFVDFDDFAILAKAWQSQPGDASWNSSCDISMLVDGVINEADLAVFCNNWLSAPIYYPGPPRIVIWNIGTLYPEDGGSVKLGVRVNEEDVPSGKITNCCEMTGDCIDINACEYTPVCTELKALWEFDEGEGTIASDSVGSYNGTLLGDHPDDPNWVDSPHCGALELDGNDCVEIGYHPVFNPTGSFSVSLWAYITEWGTPWSHVMIANRGDGNEGWALRLLGWWHGSEPSNPPANALSFTTKDIRNVINGNIDNSPTGKDSPSNTVPPLNEWVHIACVYDSINHKKYIYFNGEPNGEWDTDPNGKLNPAPQSLYIGARSDKGDTGPESCDCFDSYFRGKLDDVRFYLGVLSPEEIIPDYTQAGLADPYNNETIMTASQLLQWERGCGVFSADDYHVYFSSNRAYVKSGAVVADMGTTGGNNFFDVNDLVRGKTYYWRIDTIVDSNTYRGYIWKFYVQPEKAYDPDPCDFRGFVAVEPNLFWEAGVGAVDGHDVYFGYTFNDVNDATPVDQEYRIQLPVSDTNWAPSEAGLAPLNVNTTYYWRIDEVGATTIKGDVWEFTTVPVENLGSILCEVWLGIQGTEVEDLTSNVRYPDNPDFTCYPTKFDDPISCGSFGTRMHGWLYPWETAYYTFWIASGNQGDLWLSTDDDPENKVKIASVETEPGWTDPEEWTKFPEQKSAPISLQAGNKYYIMALHRGDGIEPDHLAVAWSANPDPNTAEVIDGTSLIPYLPIVPFAPDPPDDANCVRSAPILSWIPGIYAVTHDLYFGTDENVVKNADTGSPECIAQGLASADPTIYTNLGLLEFDTTYYWRVDDINTAGPAPCYWKGRTWSFTTGSYHVVEDFEAYADTDELDDVWSANSAIYATSDMVCEFHKGDQGMALKYDNNLSCSEAYADTVDIDNVVGTNWRLEDVNALSLWLHGIPDLRGWYTGTDPYTLEGGGSGLISTKCDSFYFFNKSIANAYARVQVKVDSIEDTDPLAMAGVMLRQNLNANSAYAATVITAADNEVIFMGRGSAGTTGSPVGDTVSGVTLPHWIRITRYSQMGPAVLYAEHANDVDGSPGFWETVGNPQNWGFSQPVRIGLCVTSNVYGDMCTAKFSNVYMGQGSSSANPDGNDVGDPDSETDIGNYVYNYPEAMYVVLQDSDSNGIVYYRDKDTSVTQIADWNEWCMDLGDFIVQGVDPCDVQRIYIGIGDKDNPSSGEGTVFIDDIRLYLACESECSLPAGLGVTSDSWFISDYEIAPVAPPIGPVSWYRLEQNTNDSAGGRHGVAHRIKTSDYVASAKEGTYALDLKGDANYIGTDCTAVDYGIDGKKPRTITAWMYARSFDEYAAIYEIGGHENGQEFSMLTNGDEPNAWRANHWGGPKNWDIDFEYPSLSTWVHFAQTYDGTTVRVYVDGYLIAERALYLDTGVDKTFSIGRWSYASFYFDGIIDDVRIYNYALSQENAAYLAGKRNKFTQPLEMLLTPRQSQH